MNKTELERFRKKLLSIRSELHELEAELKEAGKTVELDQTRVGRLSRMDAMQTQQMALEAGRRRQLQLVKIERALSRIESGDYGYCVVCGEEIIAGRLNIEPASTHCMQCIDEQV